MDEEFQTRHTSNDKYVTASKALSEINEVILDEAKEIQRLSLETRLKTDKNTGRQIKLNK